MDKPPINIPIVPETAIVPQVDVFEEVDMLKAQVKILEETVKELTFITKEVLDLLKGEKK